MKTKFFNFKFKWLLVPLVLISLGVGNMWGDDEVYKTAKFGSSYNSKVVSSYTDTWYSTYNGFKVNIANGNNNSNGWNYIKFGRKNNTSVGTIITDAVIDKKITKVTLTIDALTAAKINSIKLYTSTNKSSWTERGSFTKSAGAQTVSIGSTNQAANLYYKLEFDCASGSSNGLITVSQVDFYYSSGTSVTLSKAGTSNGSFTLTQEANNAYDAFYIYVFTNNYVKDLFVPF